MLSRMTPAIWSELAVLRREAFVRLVKELEKELAAVKNGEPNVIEDSMLKSLDP